MTAGIKSCGREAQDESTVAVAMGQAYCLTVQKIAAVVAPARTAVKHTSARFEPSHWLRNLLRKDSIDIVATSFKAPRNLLTLTLRATTSPRRFGCHPESSIDRDGQGVIGELRIRA